MSATWIDPFVGNLAAAVAELFARSMEAVACHIGPSEPAAHADGWLWLDTSAAPAYVLKVKSKTASGATRWVTVATERLAADLNFDGSATDDRTTLFQALGLRLENVAAVDIPAAGAGNAGHLAFRTNDAALIYLDGAAVREALAIVMGIDYDSMEIDLDGNNHNDGTNPPTASVVGVLHGWLFDATAEKRTLLFRVPNNWKGSSDLKVRLGVLLAAAETAGDDIDWTGTVRVLTPAMDKAGKTGTTIAASATDIGAEPDAIAEGGYHQCDLVIDHDDTTNPVAAGDLVALEISRGSVGGAGKVAGVVVVRAELLYAQGPRHRRAV